MTTVDDRPRRLISSSASAMAAAAAACDRAVSCARPSVSVTTPWLAYSPHGVVRNKLRSTLNSRSACLVGRSVRLGIQKRVVIDQRRQQCRSRNGSIESSTTARRKRRSERRLVGTSSSQGFVQTDNHLRSGLLGAGALLCGDGKCQSKRANYGPRTRPFLHRSPAYRPTTSTVNVPGICAGRAFGFAGSGAANLDVTR